MRRTIALLALLGTLGQAPAAGLRSSEHPDEAAARKLFEKNLDAIRRRDAAAYLACYLQSSRLARTGPAGSLLGYDELAKTAGREWPDTFEAADLRLLRLRPGVVYGTYRYRVRYGLDEQSGLSERLFLLTPAGWRIAVTTAFEGPPGASPPARALVGATLVDGKGGTPLADATVVLRDGRIECAGKSCVVPQDAIVTDVRGNWITPGLVDAHVHFSQTGWADGRPDALDVRQRYPYESVVADLQKSPERFFRSQLCSGVTAVFDVGGYPWTLRLPDRARFDPRAPRVAASGPLLSTVDFWLNLAGERQFLFLKDPEAARAAVRYLAAQGASAVKVWFIVTPERRIEDSEPSVLAAGEEARRRNLPLIVHATGLAEARVALRAGARLLVHGVGDRPVDDEFLALAKKSGTVYCPTLTVFAGYLRLFQSLEGKRPPEVDDPNGCVDRATLAKVAETPRLPAPEGLATRLAAQRERLERAGTIGRQNLARVHAAGIPVAMGTDAGNPLTLHGPSVYAEMEAMQSAGLTPMDVLVAATRGGSRALGLEKEIGTVEKGKSADLLVVTADPTADVASFRRVRFVVRGGVLRGIEELRAAASGPPPEGGR